MLYVAVGMPRAGSGWHYNLIHDLVIASGGDDAREIRSRFLLSPILTEVNCNIGTLKPKRLLPVMVPAMLGKKFVVKAHCGPSDLARRLIEQERIKTLYIYRDPRAALLSAHEYGQRILQRGRTNAFSHLDTIEKAVEFMKEYIDIYEEWMEISQTLHTSYENFLSNYDTEAARLLEFLGIETKSQAVMAAIARYRPGQQDDDHQGLHYFKGQPERFRTALTPEQLDYCNQELGEAIQKMGYTL